MAAFCCIPDIQYKTVNFGLGSNPAVPFVGLLQAGGLNDGRLALNVGLSLASPRGRMLCMLRLIGSWTAPGFLD